MKLVDILARELKVWPDQYYQIYQDSGGNLIGTLSNNDLEDCDSEDLPYDPVTIAWDGNSAIVERSEWQEAVDALYPKLAVAEEWNGEGLPPVGMVCEYRVGNGTWFPCTIRYVTTPISDEEVQVIIHCPHLNGDQIGGVGSGIGEINFRPARTPEQIAKQERSKACDKMYGVILDKIPQDRRNNGSDICEALYDAGYRKFEIVEGE